jgi:hypothetical protein
MDPAGDVLLDLAGWGNRLRVRALGGAYPEAADLAAREWRTVRIEVEAAPFSGVVEAVCTPDDLREFETGLARLASEGRVVLGGGRGVEVTLEREDGVVEVGITPSGDDPWPYLRYLVPVDGG